MKKKKKGTQLCLRDVSLDDTCGPEGTPGQSCWVGPSWAMPEELSYVTRGHDSWYWTLETPAPLEALCTSEEMHMYLALLE